MAFPTATAGPSNGLASQKPKSKRTAELNDSSDDEELSTPVDTPRSSPKSKRKRKLSGAKTSPEDKEGDYKRRKAEAERLFAKRQDLPFYQGRKMILDEIMKHDTTIVRRVPPTLECNRGDELISDNRRDGMREVYPTTAAITNALAIA